MKELNGIGFYNKSLFAIFLKLKLDAELELLNENLK